MNRIDQTFADLRQEGRRALLPYLTAGDPDLDTTAALIPAMQKAGAAVCEIGIPFSDPIADGPVIQASMSHALEGGVRPQQVLQMVADLRAALTMGLIAMVSYSIVYRLGSGPFLKDLAAAGMDGVIIPDLPLEESVAMVDAARELNLVCIMMVAPSTAGDRARRIARASSGFVYVLARAGLTGERRAVPSQLTRRIEDLRQVTDLPMAVGFGIATRHHVTQVVNMADAAIVGSAIMRRIADHRSLGRSVVVDQTARFVRELAAGLDQDHPEEIDG